MRDRRCKERVSWIYEQINLALWAALTGFIIFFAAYAAPQIEANRASYEAARQVEIDSEHAFYCKRLGIALDTPNHSQCMAELLQLRRSIERQIADDQSQSLP